MFLGLNSPENRVRNHLSSNFLFREKVFEYFTMFEVDNDNFPMKEKQMQQACCNKYSTS